MMTPNKRIAFVLAAFLVAGGSFFAGLVFGADSGRKKQPPQPIPVNIEEGKPDGVDFSIFWDVWNTINEKYMASNGPSDMDKTYGAVSGLVRSLDDPYSVFLPPEESEYFESEIQGNFEGVGIEIGMRSGILTVIAPLKNTPAERAGVRAGDKIIAIDEMSMFDTTVDEAVRIIRGEKGTVVTLSIVREEEDEPFDIEIMRGVIDIPTIDTIKRDDGIFVIELYSFTAASPYLFQNALREFIESDYGYGKLILDLRNNPGGYLDAAVDMASWFIPAGKPIVREVSRDGEKNEKVYRSRGYNVFPEDWEFVILINGGSASASEILAGALSEYGDAMLVGEQSFGKGSVQELVSITDDTSLKITVARWFTPNGVSISEEGLTPDIVVPFTKEDFEAGRDPQLDRAIEYFTQGQ